MTRSSKKAAALASKGIEWLLKLIAFGTAVVFAFLVIDGTESASEVFMTNLGLLGIAFIGYALLRVVFSPILLILTRYAES